MSDYSELRQPLARTIGRWADSYYAFCTDHTTENADLVGGEMARVVKLLAEHEAMRGWLMSADHQSGCSGGFSPSYRCKCGLRDLLAELETSDAVVIAREER